MASGDICSNEGARELIVTRRAAVMVGRAAQGNPWLLSEILSGETAEPSQAQIVAELVHFMREASASSARGAPQASSRSSTAGT